MLDGGDTLIGNDGEDVLFGGAGNDGIHAGHGNDTLSGQGSQDLLAGNEGVDTFNYATAVIDAAFVLPASVRAALEELSTGRPALLARDIFRPLPFGEGRGEGAKVGRRSVAIERRPAIGSLILPLERISSTCSGGFSRRVREMPRGG